MVKRDDGGSNCGSDEDTLDRHSDSKRGAGPGSRARLHNAGARIAAMLPDSRFAHKCSAIVAAIRWTADGSIFERKNILKNIGVRIFGGARPIRPHDP